MPTLLEKIEASAAKRLVLPPDRKPAEELARYKTFLKVETHRLKILHRAGAGGREICQARSAVLDVLLRYLLAGVKRDIPLDPQNPAPSLALVAIGGYGRAELSPQSDVDILFLHDGELGYGGKPHPYLRALTDGLLYTLWDIGLKVGHSFRTVEDCVKVANGDMRSKTALIEARFITGEAPLFERLQRVVLAKCVRGYEDAYNVSRLEDQEARRAKYGNSSSMQEPNIKNGCGGLRDYQNLLWMAFFKYRTLSLEDLQHRELISESERKQLETAYDYLLRVRNELHYQVNRPVDVLTKAVQPSVASQLGYGDRSPVKRIEKFMCNIYTHMRNIHLITRTLEQRLALLPQPKRLPSFRELIRTRRQQARQLLFDGFKFIEGEIHPGSPRVFEDRPRRLMRVFLYAQQRGLRLHPDLTQLIRNQLHLVDRSLIHDSHVHETFLEILDERGNVAPVLRAMHEVGLLGKFLPEFGRLTCLVQHEFYHRYTADEHTLVCLEKLDRIWDAHTPPFNHYTELFKSLERPFLLYLALLLHDAGKGVAKAHHADAGVRLAQRVAKRLDLDNRTTESLCLIIENHLLMAQISQRRDLEDPNVIRSFARKIKTPENLALLTLHTFADSMGTSENLWNDFKESLLWTLHQKTRPLLTGGTDFLRDYSKRRSNILNKVRRLAPRNVNREEIDAHFEGLPPRYFQVQTPREILADITLTHRFMQLQVMEEERALEPVVRWHNERDRGYAALTVCTWDRAGLFASIAGALTASRLNILGAQIFSRTDGIILDTFFVHHARTGKLPRRDERETFEQLLKQALTGHADFFKLISELKDTHPLYQPLEGERIETLVDFDNEISESYTVIDVQTEDRVGLLYMISRALTGLGLDIAVAKICTEKGAATDTFYVKELDGGKVTFPPRLYDIEQEIRDAVVHLDHLNKEPQKEPEAP